MTIKIPPFKLVPEPLSPKAAELPKFKWVGKDPGGGEIDTRHKLGGSLTSCKPPPRRRSAQTVECP